MPRLFRQSPLNAIWEGSNNVIALDVLRAIGREPDSVAALRYFLEAQRGRDADYDAWIAHLHVGAREEAHARATIERLALAAQAAVLLASESPLATAFCRLRLTPPCWPTRSSSRATNPDQRHPRRSRTCPDQR